MCPQNEQRRDALRRNRVIVFDPTKKQFAIERVALRRYQAVVLNQQKNDFVIKVVAAVRRAASRIIE